MVNLPIFIMLLGILVSVANLTASTWNYEPTEQTIETLDANTAVTFANPSGEKLAKKGDYEVAKRYVTIKAKRPSTGEIQNIKVLIRKPKGLGTDVPVWFSCTAPAMAPATIPSATWPPTCLRRDS